tara:strand:- start:1102 stop:1527 length:426 start_codon:yes stop_codon:yes gene_type:complete
MVKHTIGFLFIILFFSGCAEWELGLDKDSDPPPPPKVAETAYPFLDIPIPVDFSRDNSKTFIYESGSGTVKVGRLFFHGLGKLNDALTFYQNEMLNNGWTLVNSIKNESVVLNYEKEGMVSTIILRSNLLSTFIEIQIGPK